MMAFKKLLTAVFLSVALVSCVANDSDNTGSTTPIDSTNMHGTAPATYGAHDPATIQDTIFKNSRDTGTGVSTGPDRTIDPNINKR